MQCNREAYSSIEFDESYDASQMNADLLAAIENAYKSQNVDIYVTGSNSKLLSSEISTFLTGRFVFILVYTLSFLEFMEFKKTYFSESAEKSMDEYFDMEPLKIAIFRGIFEIAMF